MEQWKDDRGSCKECVNFGSKVVRESYPTEVMEKFRFVNHPALHWMIESARVKDGVARVSYKTSVCKVKELTPIVDGTPHRCDWYNRPVQEQGQQEGAAWWE